MGFMEHHLENIRNYKRKKEKEMGERLFKETLLKSSQILKDM
jgi:hypothetical protein